MANKIYAISVSPSHGYIASDRQPSGENAALYAKWDLQSETLDRGFTGVFAESWQGTEEQRRWMEKAASSGRSIPSLYLPKTGKVYFLHEDQYVRCTLATHTVDEGYPKTIGSYWPGLRAVGFDSGIDAVLWWDEKTAYFFKGNQYVRYNLETDKADEGYPKTIGSYWAGFKEAGFGSDIDAFIRWDAEWAYAFKGDQYIRFHVPTDKTDQAPRKSTSYWNPLDELGSRRVLTLFQAPDVTAPVRVSFPKAQLTDGFPTGTFKITNAETGLCLEAYVGSSPDTKAGTHAVENPTGGRSEQTASLEKCSNSKNQLWRYNPKRKTLESVGASGRCLVMDPAFGQAAGGKDEGESSGMTAFNTDGIVFGSAPKGAAWVLALHGCNTDPSTFHPGTNQFRAEDGYITLADTNGAKAQKSYWTAEKNSKTAMVHGMAKGGPRQKWIFTPAT